MSGAKFSLSALVVGLCALGACGVEPGPALRIASPDAMRFATNVYPVLLRDCGFPACHGATDRFLSMVGPGRTRLSMNADPGEPATEQEIQHSYDRARSMIDVSAPERSLLLRKPLAVSAGGAGHKGKDSLGRNVYQSANDPNFQVLRGWVLAEAPSKGDAGVAP